jgi:energy-coupling factor transporter ATP-binding protein EcfA2
MIIIISGNQGSGKTTYAKALAKSLFPHTIPDIVEGVPAQEPSFLGSMTIFTRQSEEFLPDWILRRPDYTMIYLDSLKREMSMPSTDTLYPLFQSAKQEIQEHIQDDPYAQSVSMAIGNVLINGKEVQMQLTFQREEDEFIDGFTAVMVRGCRKY